MSTLSVGSDPELFIIDKNGKPKSAIGLIKGTKDNKYDLGNGIKIFPDNVNLELNIPACNSSKSLCEVIRKSFSKITKELSPYTIKLQASGYYPEEECEHPDAKLFGCEAEYCAYQLEMVQAPSCTSTFRSCGGHIHLGYNKPLYPLTHPEDDTNESAFGKIRVIRMMDLFVGIPSLWLDNDPTSPDRRKLYGKAGTHRPKNYGVEYRATGNYWLSSPELVTLTFKLCDFVVNFVKNRNYEKLWKSDDECIAYSPEELQESINNSNKNLAQKLLNGVVKENMPKDLFNEIIKVASLPKKTLNVAWGI